MLLDSNVAENIAADAGDIGNTPQTENNSLFVPDVFGEIAEIENEKEAETQLSIIHYLISKMDMNT